MGISKAQVECLQTLLDFLVASACTTSIETIMRKHISGAGTGIGHGYFPAGKCKTVAIQRRDILSSAAARRSIPMSLDEQSMTLDTNAGSIYAKILSARSYNGSLTLAFTFGYIGYAKLGLSPFVVHFMSSLLSTTLTSPRIANSPQLIKKGSVVVIVAVVEVSVGPHSWAAN